MKFIVAGDILIQRRIPNDYEGIEDIKSFIAKGDARYCNLETTLSRGEFFPEQYCGGSYWYFVRLD